MGEADIARVVGILGDVGARWALVGAHAVGLLTTPRATAGFDFIVEERKLRAVIASLRDAFGELGEQDVGAAVRLTAIDIDLIRSTNHPLFKEALDHVNKVGDWNIPRAEVLIALKFLAAVSPWRNLDKRTYDMGDLRSLYRAVGRETLDVALMQRLAAMAYPGAEREFATLLERIDRGDPVEI
jgi:hypothetical protein